MTLIDFIPWVLSFTTAVTMWMAGGKAPMLGWAFALLAQVLWIVYTFVAHAWGFLPLNVILTFIYFRNSRNAYLEWRNTQSK